MGEDLKLERAHTHMHAHTSVVEALPFKISKIKQYKGQRKIIIAKIIFNEII